MFGTDYPTPDGTAIRDYIHVEDLGEAHLLGARAATNPGEHRIYNLGNGTGFSVREVIETARAVTGRDIPVVEEPRRPGDPPRSWPPRSGSAPSSAGFRRKPGSRR